MEKDITAYALILLSVAVGAGKEAATGKHCGNGLPDLALDEGDGMTIEVHTALPGGYEMYCAGCKTLFSVSADKALPVKYCPLCGFETLVNGKKKSKTELFRGVLKQFIGTAVCFAILLSINWITNIDNIGKFAFYLGGVVSVIILQKIREKWE